MAKYLNGTRKDKLGISGDNDEGVLLAKTDTDQAGDKTTRRSTTCGTFFYAGTMLGNFSRSQKPIALSSAESEYYGAADGVAVPEP